MKQDNENQGRPNNPERKDKPMNKPSLVLVVWLLIFGIIGVLLVSNFPEQTKKIEQTRFIELLDEGLIANAVMTLDQAPLFIASGEMIDPATEERTPYQAQIKDSELIDAKLAEYKAAHPDFSLSYDRPDNFVQNLIFSLLPILLIVGLLYFLFSRQLKSAGKGAMQFGKSKARMIPPEDLKVKFDDIAGADEAKEETKEIIDFLKSPEKFQKVGGKIPKGVLLMGPPGTGKTLLAKAVAAEANAPFFSISGSDFVEMFVGVGASRVRDMFEQARKHSPSIIFIDEIDAVGRSRFSGMGGGHDEREQTLNAMLVEMDGLESQGSVIIIAATNRPDVLDPALLRPGRFDRQISLDLPDIKGRRQIIDVHINNIKVADNVNLDLIARGTPGFSGADIANLINEAALHAARHDRDCATAIDFEDARDKVNWGRERKSKRMPEKERINTSYHEVGHALVTLHCPDATPLHKVSIIPRGRALGMTMSLPLEDTYSTSLQEFKDRLAVLMGGRVAEEIKFGDYTSGASSDIDRATNIAHHMVCSFGMSTKMGIMKYGSDQQDEMHPGGHKQFSEQTAREIDLEIRAILDEAQGRARTIITENIDQFESFAQVLLERETMDVKEVKELLGMPIDDNFDALTFDTGSKPAPAMSTEDRLAALDDSLFEQSENDSDESPAEGNDEEETTS